MVIEFYTTGSLLAILIIWKDNIGRCINFLLRIADKVIVLDTYSYHNAITIASQKSDISPPGDQKPGLFNGYILHVRLNFVIAVQTAEQSYLKYQKTRHLQNSIKMSSVETIHNYYSFE